MSNENTLQPTNNEGVDVAASEQTEDRILDKKVSRRAMLVGSGALAMTGALAKVTGVVGSGATKANAAGWADVEVTMAGTDGWTYLAGAPHQPFFPDTFAPDGFNTYIFGLRDLTGLSEAQVLQQKGNAQFTAPILGFRIGQKIELTLFNLGLHQRPDLVDSHTFHWHGFRNAIPLYDGTPDTSLSVPIGRHLKYRFQPHESGTYMYHCHFEDVEHVQMGMIGIVYVMPAAGSVFANCAYEDARTAFNRQFTIMLTEVDSHIHWNDAHIQVSDFTDYTPDHWTMNGRSYPDTLAGHGHRDPVSRDMVTGPALSDAAGSLDHSPVSSLIEANAGDKVLVRLASLGFQEHTLVAPGIDMTIVGQDARCVLDVNGFGNRSVSTNTVSIGSGESRDVIFTAPAYDATTATAGGYNVYRLFDRTYGHAANSSSTGDGGQMTEIRVFNGTLGAQVKLTGEHI